MFLSKHAHPHTLRPADYSDPAVFDEERRRVFLHSWHVVCAAADLAVEGAQYATEAAGVPLVVRRERGALRAFRNVCPHRHSVLVRPGRHRAPTLKCQYHGWEFGADGRLCHLPDGRSFRGFKAKDACLDVLPCEEAYGLVFVRPLATGVEGPPPRLADSWAALHPQLASHFGGTELRIAQVTEHEVNWKVIVENAVESYHVPMVHPETFGNYREEALHGHVIAADHTQYHDLASEGPASLRWAVLDVALYQRPRLHGYSHLHLYPNHLVTWSGLYREWVFVEPLGPRRTRRRAYGFMPADMRRGVPFSSLLKHEFARRTRKSAERILAEDSCVWGAVQRGSEASDFAGVLSAREERVASFQQWLVERRTAGARPR
jgi:choline monooxygenase